MNGYFELTLNAEIVGLKFGMRALRQIQEKQEKSEVKLFDKVREEDGIERDRLNEMGTAYILYAGYCNYCVVREFPVKYHFLHFYDLVEDAFLTSNGIDQIREAINVFSESQSVKATGGGSGSSADAEESEKKSS